VSCIPNGDFSSTANPVSCYWSNYQDQATPDQIPGKWVEGNGASSSACESAWGGDMKSSCFDGPCDIAFNGASGTKHFALSNQTFDGSS
jgi:hypothetical protein